MGDEKGRKSPQGAFNWEAEVKPRGPGARAELPLARPQAESPMFGETLQRFPVVCTTNTRNGQTILVHREA